MYIRVAAAPHTSARAFAVAFALPSVVVYAFAFASASSALYFAFARALSFVPAFAFGSSRARAIAFALACAPNRKRQRPCLSRSHVRSLCARARSGYPVRWQQPRRVCSPMPLQYRPCSMCALALAFAFECVFAFGCPLAWRGSLSRACVRVRVQSLRILTLRPA